MLVISSMTRASPVSPLVDRLLGTRMKLTAKAVRLQPMTMLRKSMASGCSPIFLRMVLIFFASYSSTTMMASS